MVKSVKHAFLSTMIFISTIGIPLFTHGAGGEFFVGKQRGGASNNGTKRGLPAKVTPTSRDISKKVSSLPIIVCVRMFYTEITYFYLRVTCT